MIDCTGDIYVENETEQTWLIGPGAAYEESDIGQWCDWLYRCGLW